MTSPGTEDAAGTGTIVAANTDGPMAPPPDEVTVWHRDMPLVVDLGRYRRALDAWPGAVEWDRVENLARTLAVSSEAVRRFLSARLRSLPLAVRLADALGLLDGADGPAHA
jgi:hypothetical protein